MNNWIIFYGDGSRFPITDDLVCTVRPEDAPTKNVQAIAIEDPVRAPNPYTVGRWVLESYDYYMWSDGVGWHGTLRTSDLIDHLSEGIGEGGVRAVLMGRWIGDDNYRAIQERAETEGPFHSRSSGTKYPRTGREVD